MPYLTTFNESRILEKTRTEIRPGLSWKDIYSEPMFFWNNLELSQLEDYKRFCQGDVKLEATYRYADPIDNKRFVYEGRQPSYHRNKECQGLNSSFNNIELPSVVQNWEIDKLEQFRSWFRKEVEDENDDSEIKEKIWEKWQIRYDVKRVRYKNSGPLFKENLDLAQIESRIDSLLEAERTFYSKRGYILDMFAKRSFLGFKDTPIDNPPGGWSEDELKELLLYYHSLYKAPLLHYFREYFQIKFSKEIEFNGTLLDELGFRQCNSCYQTNSQAIFTIKENIATENSMVNATEFTPLDQFLKSRGVKAIDRDNGLITFSTYSEYPGTKYNYSFKKLVSYRGLEEHANNAILEFIINDQIYYFPAQYDSDGTDKKLNDLQLYQGYLVCSAVSIDTNKITGLMLYPYSINDQTCHF